MLTEALSALAERYGVNAVYFFGSRAKEMAFRLRGGQAVVEHPGSDVDVGVTFRGGAHPDLRGMIRLGMALEDILDVDRVDVVDVWRCDPFLAVEIIQGERVYCRDEDQEAETELYVLARAGDLLPFQRERIQQVLHPEAGHVAG
ncbi:Predicted nucleotidyltransferase [Desulfonatronum zhilinae]|nr:Predicted nucleotidyltransferase [Desulfonatronum zhilinae]